MNHYSYFKDIIDAHVHVFGDSIYDVDRLVKQQQEFGYVTSNLLSCECMDDAAQNALLIYLKLKYPDYYTFGGFLYRFDYPYAEEAKRLMDIGFDGIKMVENKPNIRKKLNMPTNDKRYDEFYAYMEREKIPMIVHVADPEEFWDKDKIPVWAIEAGFFYGDGTYVDKETIYSELFDVLNRYPKLNISMAHFLFLSDDRERLASLMETYPNMKLDIVAGTEMYFNFSKDVDAWREFFITYQDRILFGTDNCEPNDMEIARIINRFENEFLTKTGEIPAWDQTMKGIGLSADVLSKIYRMNFLHFAGEIPKKIDGMKAVKYLKGRLNDSRYCLTNRERKIITLVLDELMPFA